MRTNETAVSRLYLKCAAVKLHTTDVLRLGLTFNWCDMMPHDATWCDLTGGEKTGFAWAIVVIEALAAAMAEGAGGASIKTSNDDHIQWCFLASPTFPTFIWVSLRFAICPVAFQTNDYRRWFGANLCWFQDVPSLFSHIFFSWPANFQIARPRPQALPQECRALECRALECRALGSRTWTSFDRDQIRRKYGAEMVTVWGTEGVRCPSQREMPGSLANIGKPPIVPTSTQA